MRPGVHLREMMDDSGLTGDFGVRAVSRISGLPATVVEGILSGKQLITEDIAHRLAAGTAPLRISAKFWLNLEMTYRKGLAAGKSEVQ